MITTPTQLSPTQMTFHCRPLILVYRFCKSTPPPPPTHTHIHTSIFSHTYPHSPTRTQPLIRPSVPIHQFLPTSSYPPCVLRLTAQPTPTRFSLTNQSINQVSVGPPPESAFALSPYCGVPSPACTDASVVPLVAVVFHPANNTNIAGQDVGDLLGDTMFLCFSGPGARSGGAQYAQVSLWNLNVWSGCESHSTHSTH
jgi:hypothetical protein